MHVFGIAEESPDFRPGIENFFVRGKCSVVINPRNFLAEITGCDGSASGTFICPPWINTGGDCSHRGTELRDGLGILERERLARAPIRAKPSGVGAGVEAGDEKRFRATDRQKSVHVP